MELAEKPKLVFVCGLSGAGRSVAIRSLEDMGFYCIDRLPTALIQITTQHLKQEHARDFAIGLDFRDQTSVSEFLEFQKALKKDFDVETVFLTSSDEMLHNRYNATRRRHPMSAKVEDLHLAIQYERKILRDIEASADVCFDTSDFSPHFLARQIEDRYSSDATHRKLFVSITSFGFSHGSGQQFDMILDVRFLRNPHFDAELKNKTGIDAGVADYIKSDVRYQPMLDQTKKMLLFLLPEYFKEGKNYFRVGIGCTGGKHRSVCFAEALSNQIQSENLNYVYLTVKHRDVSF